MSTEILEKKKKFKIKVDNQIFEFDKSIVTGSEILTKAGKTPIECYSLYQKFKGCDFEKISLDEPVDLSKPGLEQFTVKEAEVFNYTVDGEPEMTDKKTLSANEILALIGLNPSDYYLVQLNPDGTQTSYKDNPDEPIIINCTGLKFVSAYRSGTPVA
jgi:hypothetical protein